MYLVESLDNAKQMYYLLKFLLEYEYDSDTPFDDVVPPLTQNEVEIVERAQKMLSDGLVVCKNDIEAGKEVDVVAEIKKTIDSIRSSLWTVTDENGETVCVVDAILDVSDYADTKFYAEMDYGEFWNEVNLPDEVDNLFRAYIATIKDAGIVPEDADLSNGMVAISYYDLSDSLIIFESMAKAEAFAEANPVDPTDFLEYQDGCWNSL